MKFYPNWIHIKNRTLVKSVWLKIIFLFLNQNICCWYSKEPSHGDGSFEHSKHMLKLMGKKMLTLSGLKLRVRTIKYFSYFKTKTYVVGTQKNRLNETVLLSTQNICYNLWVRGYWQFYAENLCLSEPMHCVYLDLCRNPQHGSESHRNS